MSRDDGEEGLNITLDGVVALLAGLVQIGLAALLLRVGFQRPWNRAFALFLIVLGCIRVSGGLSTIFPFDQDFATNIFLRRVNPYFSLSDEIALLGFAAVFPVQAGWLRRLPWPSLPTLLGLAVVWGLYGFDHSLFFGSLDFDHARSGAADGPLIYLDRVLNITYAGVPLLLARAAVASPPGPRRSSTALVSLAVALVFFYPDARATMTYLFGLGRIPGSPLEWLTLATLVIRLGLFGAVAATFLRHARGAEPDLRRPARVYLGGLGLAVASAAVLVALTSIATANPTSPVRAFLVETRINSVVSGLWYVAGGLIVTYALLRHQLFDIDLKVKWTIKQSTIAAAFVGVFFVVSEAAQTFFASSLGPYFGVAAAGMLVFAMAPLQHAAERVASAAMPGVRSTETLSGGERAALYRDLARQAWADGQLTREERDLLETARQRLGLSRDEAALLDQEGSRPGVVGGEGPPAVTE